MKKKDLAIIGSAAVVTVTLTLGTFLPGSLDAGAGDTDPVSKIIEPKLISHGVEVTVAKAIKRPIEAGDEPVLELKAVNTLNKAAEVPVRVSMTSTSFGDMRSRLAVMSLRLWEEQLTLTLQPNEAKTIVLATKTRMPANSSVNVLLMSLDTAVGVSSSTNLGFVTGVNPVPIQSMRQVVAMTFSTRQTPVQPALTLAKNYFTNAVVGASVNSVLRQLPRSGVAMSFSTKPTPVQPALASAK